MIRLIVSLTLCICFAFNGYAQSTDSHPNGEQITDTLEQIVVTGQFRPQPKDRSIYKIEVIDTRQIRLKGANNMSELLRSEPGFQFTSGGIWGDFIRIRGLSGEHIKILIDGIPVTGRMADWIDLGQLSLQNVDHIEVIEGPMSVIYGSNSLAGAINIITSDYSGKKLHASVNSYLESAGIYNFGLVGGTSFKSHTFSLNVARNFFSGWGPVDSSRFKTIKPKLQYLAGATYRFQRKQLKINMNTDYLHEELRDPGALALANLYEKALDGYHYSTRWNNRFNLMNIYHNNFVMNLEAGYSYFKKRKITYLNDLVHLIKTEASPDLHDTTSFHMYSARGFISNITGQKFEYQAGFDLSYETAFGKRTGGHRQISDAAGFMNFILRPAKIFSFQPGIRVMHNSLYKAPLVYGLSVKINPAPFTIRANYARGFRAPSLRQLYLHFKDSNHEILGNEDLKAETADNISLSVNYDQTKDKHAWGAEFNLFYNGIKNAVQLAVSLQQPGWGKYFNIDNTLYKTKGAELNIYYRNSGGLSLNTGAISTGRVMLNDPDRFSWSTDISASVSYRFNPSGTQIALFYKYSDAFLEFAGNFDADGNMDGVAQEFIEDYHILDATVTKNLMKNRLRFSGGIKNIFDVTMVNSFGNLNIHGNTDAGATRGYGRTFFINLLFTIAKPEQE